MPLTPSSICPRGSGLGLTECCGRLIYQGLTAETAEQLMRSRYSAHVLRAIDYIWQSWSETTRQCTTPEAIRDWAESCEWLKLDILHTDDGGTADDTGTVTFCAHYRLGDHTHQHPEKSLFQREAGQWHYVAHCP